MPDKPRTRAEMTRNGLRGVTGLSVAWIAMNLFGTVKFRPIEVAMPILAGIAAALIVPTVIVWFRERSRTETDESAPAPSSTGQGPDYLRNDLDQTDHREG